MTSLKTLGLLTLMLLGLTGCGGGGHGSSGAAPQPTRVSGIASKGIFTSGTVNLYALVDGKRGALLKQAAINPAFGTYSANLGSFVGPIVAEASGDYHDEATGTTLTVPADAPIRAALPLAQGTVNLPVTALTEIAVQKTGGSFTPAAIDAANKVVSDLFKVDIVATQPVAPSANVLNGVSADQVTYTLALATISQLSWNGSRTLAATLADVASNIDVASSSMTSATANQLQGALTSFTGNPQNSTGITDPSTSPLANVGKRTVRVTVSVPGSALIGGVQGTFDLPQGVTLNAGSPALAGKAVGAILETHPGATSLSIGILSSLGFAAGDVLSFTCSVPSDRAVPVAADFPLSKVKVLDAARVLLPVSLNLAVATQTSSTVSSGSSFNVTLSVPQGLPLVGGLQGMITLPAGYTLNPGSTTLTGSAVGSLLETKPEGPSFTFGIASNSGFASGPFLTFTCTRTAAGGAPDASAFAASGVRIIDRSGTTLGASLILAVN
jgi:hypothetical protein